ncbi:MAG: FHA domain-containing protein [Acidimicrobiales bacterium]
MVIDPIGDRLVDFGSSALVSDLVAELVNALDAAAAPTDTASPTDPTSPTDTASPTDSASADETTSPPVPERQRSLRVERTGQILAPDLKLALADIRPGDRVSVLEIDPAAHLSAKQQLKNATATLEMLSGPLKGSLYSLDSGPSTIGRVSSNDVVIVDPGISRHHAIITVDQASVTIVDNGSTNGIEIDGETITEPTQLQSAKPVMVGHSLLSVIHHPALELAATPGVTTIERPSREIRRFDEQTITLPVAPEASTKRRRTDLLSSSRGRHRLAVEHFQASVAAIDRRLQDGQEVETAARFEEAPSISEIQAASGSLWRLWERHALDPDGLEVRLGVGTMPSRTTLRLPAGGDPELRAQVADIPERYHLIPNLPAVVDFRRLGSIGLSGPKDSVDPLACSMVGQLAWFHGPDQLGLACVPGLDSESWDWLKWLPHLAYSEVSGPDSHTGFVRWVSALLDGTPTSFIDPSTSAAEPGPRPPAIVLVVHRDHNLSSSLFNRLLQDGPALGIYSLVIAGDQPDSGVSLGSDISVGVETANIDRGLDEHIGGITVEPIELQAVTDLARMLSSIRYADEVDVDVGVGVDETGQDIDSGPEPAAADGVVVQPFRRIAIASSLSEVDPGESPSADSAPAVSQVAVSEATESGTAESELPESEAAAEPASPAVPSMPERPIKQAPYRSITSLPHSDDDGRLVLGTIHTDDRSTPAVFAWNLSRDGSLGLTGGAGAGKTSALRSVAASVALLRVDSAVVPLIYYLDVRGDLEGIGALPNCVGAARSDIDGFRSIVATLEQRLNEPAPIERRVLVLIDEVDAFVELMDSLEPGQAETVLRRLVNEGPELGMHLVLTANSRDALVDSVAFRVGRWLAIGSPDPDENATSNSSDAGSSQTRPGTAKIGKNEIRFAPLADTDSVDEELSGLAEQLIERQVSGPPELA